jgi:hypothetical protein
LEQFSTKDFAYLWNTDYVPEPVKRDLRARSEGLLGGEKNIVNVPRIEKDNENYKSFTK